jgi:hypothetical protein
MVALARPPVVLPFLAWIAEVAARLHVGARGEYLARARQHRDAGVGAVRDGVEDIGHLEVELFVLRIDWRRVHGDDGDMVGDVESDEFKVHGRVLRVAVLLARILAEALARRDQQGDACAIGRLVCTNEGQVPGSWQRWYRANPNAA